MAKNGFKVMDSDMHVIEPADLWDRYTEPAYRDRSPKGYSERRGDFRIKLEGQILPNDPPWWEEVLINPKADIYQDPAENNWDSASQARAMDKEGIDVAVLYPSRGLFALAMDGLDPGLGSAIATAYNSWMHDFCSYAPDKMYGAGMVSPFDVESAVTEARRCVQELGFKAIFLRPNIVNGRNWHDPYYDPLWAEIESIGVPLGFHEGSPALVPQVGDRFETFMMLHTVSHPLEMMLSAVSMIGGGVLERFPKLRVAFLEANCSWAPWLIWRLDEHYELSGRFESPELKLEPMEYFKRQCYASVEADEEPAAFVEEFGLGDNIVFSTDYPHEDAKYPHATERFLTMPLSEETKRKMLWDTCARMYGFS